MTSLQSRQYELFRRLDEKLLLESGEARGFPPLVSRELVIVVDATDLLLDQDLQADSIDLDVTAGAYIVALTVPKGERWHLIHLNKGATAANSHVEINRSVANSNHQLTVDAQAFDIVDLKGITLETGDSIGMISTDNVGDGAVLVRILFNKETLGLAQ